MADRHSRLRAPCSLLFCRVFAKATSCFEGDRFFGVLRVTGGRFATKHDFCAAKWNGFATLGSRKYRNMQGLLLGACCKTRLHFAPIVVFRDIPMHGAP